MSSHHVVRDEQEPALLVLTDSYDTELLDSLLEWSPTVLVDASSISAPPRFNVDIVIGTVKECELAQTFLSDQEPVKYLSKNEVDNTLLQALFYLKASKHTALNIIGQFNELSFASAQAFMNTMTLTVIDHRVKWHWNRGRVFKKWKPAKSRLLLMDGIKPLEIRNLIDDTNMFTTQKDGVVEVKMADAGFWLGECI